MNAAVRLVEVRVPDMGNFKDVAVIDILVKPGESIEPEAPLVTLETEKATMDVPSTTGGVIEKVHVEKGGKVSAGDLIATVRPAGEAGQAAAPAPAAPAAPPASKESPAKEPVAATATKSAAVAAPAAPAAAGTPAKTTELPEALRSDLPPINEPGFSRAHAGPSVRRFARELGVDLTRVTGQGFKGRITHDDVKAFVKGFMTAPGSAAGAKPGGGALPVVPAVDFAAFGPIET